MNKHLKVKATSVAASSSMLSLSGRVSDGPKAMMDRDVNIALGDWHVVSLLHLALTWHRESLLKALDARIKDALLTRQDKAADLIKIRDALR